MTVWSMVERLKMEKRHSQDKRVVEQGSRDCSTESEEWTSSESENEQPRVRNSSSNALPREKDVPPHKPHRQLCRSPCLDQPSFSQSSLLQDLKLEDGQASSDKEYQAKMDFALKLGYAGDQIQAVLNKLGADALINDILAELVRLGNKAENEGPASLGSGAAPTSGTAAKEVTSPEFSLEEDVVDSSDNLRPIVIDGSNVAMSHGNKEGFSCRGIQLAVDWFLEKGHRDITVFVPTWRKEQSRPDAPITDQEILHRLEKEKILVFTPSRRVQGRRVVCYDDRFILKLAYDSDGIIVSNDNYRDLQNEKPEWKKFIEERLLMYSFEKARKKCTYGHKCKYYHPERTNQPLRSVADELRISAKLSAVKTMSEGALAKCGSGPALCKGGENISEVKRNPPKRQSDPSIRSVAWNRRTGCR
ncbi:hypothetical protein E2320_012893 [Naja naja]|nr:hypothetical protein E2320_012893 [Naja naja]